jgi:hypothetical protein
MNLSLELRLRLLRDFSALVGVGALIFGVGHIAAAFGSDWGYVGAGTTRSHVVMGLVTLGAGLVCSWVRMLANGELRRRDWVRRELQARQLGASAEENLMGTLGGQPKIAPKPKHV